MIMYIENNFMICKINIITAKIKCLEMRRKIKPPWAQVIHASDTGLYQPQSLLKQSMALVACRERGGMFREKI